MYTRKADNNKDSISHDEETPDNAENMKKCRVNIRKMGKYEYDDKLFETKVSGRNDENIEDVAEKKLFEWHIKTNGVVRQFGYNKHIKPYLGNDDVRKWFMTLKKEKEDEKHILSGNCPIYGNLTKKFPNTDNDSELVNFFSAVLARREQLEEEERRPLAAGGGAGSLLDTFQCHANVHMH